MANRINGSMALPILGKTADELPVGSNEKDLKAELEEVKQRGNQIIDEAQHEIQMRNKCIKESVDIIKKALPYVKFCVENGIVSGTREDAQALSEQIDAFLNGPSEKPVC